MTKHEPKAPYGANAMEPVTEGTVITLKLGPYKEEREYVVGPSCGTETAGTWYCVTCDELFTSNIAKDTHVVDGDDRVHRLAWACWTHGPEVP